MTVSSRRGWLLRRVLLAPLVPLLALVAVVAWPVVVVLSAVVAVGNLVGRRRRPRWRAVRVVTFALVYLVSETGCLLACLLLWVACGLGLGLRRAWVVQAHRWMLARFLGLLVGLAGPVFGFRLEVDEPGDQTWTDRVDPVVVLARHAGPGASFVLVQLLVSRYGRDPHVVLKEQLRLDPSIDLLLTRTGCTWVGRHQGAEPIACAAAGLGRRQALVLYPEGADWTPVRQLAAVARLRGQGRLREAREAVRMPHVLPTRTAGTLAALQAAPTADVLVFTHTGHDDLLDAVSTWNALPLRVPLQMAWWLAPARTVPHDDVEQVDAWLHETWASIDEWIEQRAVKA